jgi:putative endonuclease
VAEARLGEFGEEQALRFLKGQGYQVIARNYRWRGGEIDIIARDGDTLAFIEVKTRADEGFAPVEEALTQRKRERLIRTAEHYIARYCPKLDLRFDVVAVVGDEVRLYKDAFRPEE